MEELSGKVVVITGAGRGIGAAIAQAFAKAGAKVCVSARSEAQIGAIAAAITDAGGDAISVPCDVADLEAVERLFSIAQQRFGGIDIVVANAGIGGDGRTLENSEPALWKSIVDTNLLGTYHTARSAIPYLRQSAAGKIIVIGSGTGHRASPNNAAYACSKAAVWMLVRALALELASTDICVNELIPGIVETELLEKSRAVDEAGFAQLGQIEWIKLPDDVVPLALFLAAQPPRGPTAQSYGLARREC